jgi:hypothetical protein
MGGADAGGVGPLWAKLLGCPSGAGWVNKEHAGIRGRRAPSTGRGAETEHRAVLGRLGRRGGRADEARREGERRASAGVCAAKSLPRTCGWGE